MVKSKVLLNLLGMCAQLLLGALLGIQPVSASSFRVEQDGTGDFLEIQSAVNAASPGDTILIGPGDYNQLHEVLIPNWQPIDVIALVETDGLVFIGSGRDQVFVGPDVYERKFNSPIGLMGVSLSQPWSVEGITFKNLYTGVYTYGHLSSKNCRYQDIFGSGLSVWATDGLLVDNCLFENNLNGGILAWGPAFGFEVKNSEFRNGALWFQNCQGISISSCTHFGGNGGGGGNGVTFDSSSGNISSCVGEGFEVNALQALGGSNMHVSNCNFQSLKGVVTATFGSAFVAENSIFSGGNEPTFFAYNGALVNVNGSHILRENSRYVSCLLYSGSPITFDFTNNFWGTADLDTISTHIWDGNDDPGLLVTIDYEPISVDPLPIATGKKSFGGLKAMFR